LLLKVQISYTLKQYNNFLSQLFIQKNKARGGEREREREREKEKKRDTKIFKDNHVCKKDLLFLC